jgi:hypothetical protein
MDIQKMLDTLGDAQRRTRSEYHLTLGKAIEELKKLDQSFLVVLADGQSPGSVESYRGYYQDLSIYPTDSSVTVGNLLTVLEGAVGRTFRGYKGGDFTMDLDTPLWTGSIGPAIMGVAVVNDVAILLTKEID